MPSVSYCRSRLSSLCAKACASASSAFISPISVSISVKALISAAASRRSLRTAGKLRGPKICGRQLGSCVHLRGGLALKLDLKVPRHALANRFEEKRLADEVIKSRVQIIGWLAQQAGRRNRDAYDAFVGPSLAQAPHGTNPVHYGHAYVHKDECRVAVQRSAASACAPSFALATSTPARSKNPLRTSRLSSTSSTTKARTR